VLAVLSGKPVCSAAQLPLCRPVTAWPEVGNFPTRAWRVGSYSIYSVNDYMFDIPTNWAAANTPGMLLATGRYRDGGWSGQGPTLFACGPWLTPKWKRIG